MNQPFRCYVAAGPRSVTVVVRGPSSPSAKKKGEEGNICTLGIAFPKLKVSRDQKVEQHVQSLTSSPYEVQ